MAHEIIVSPYYNHRDKTYQNILIISSTPSGPLAQHTKRININDLSAFKTNLEQNCIYAIQDFDDSSKLLTIESISKLTSFLLSNNYTINYEVTKLIRPQLPYNLLFLFSHN